MIRRVPNPELETMQSQSRALPAALGLVLVALAAAPLAIGCSGSHRKPEAQWQSMPDGRPLVAPADSVLWQVTLLALEKQGFPLGSGLDPTTMTATTGWKLQLAPFRGRGTRHEATVRYEPLGGGKYKVQVRVRKELNMALVNQLDPTYAEWEPAPDDVDMARVLLQHIRARLDPTLELRPEDEDPLAPWRTRQR